MKNFFILLFLINIIKSEVFFASEVNGHDINDKINGYSSFKSFIMTDFYLCSERYYRVHYINESEENWSKEFTACQPVGNGQSIDGISISGGLEYGSRHELKYWITGKTKYNISDEKDGYTGQLKDEADAIYIYGDEYYRAGQVNSDCSHENEVARRLISAFFGEEYKNKYNFLFEKETKISLEKETKINITLKLLKPYEINYKGKITYKTEDRNLINKNCNNLINENLKKILNDTINLDITPLEKFFDDCFSIRNVIYGDIMINFNWINKKIEIDLGSKIGTNYHGYRGGFRINFYLDDEDNKVLSRIKKICLIIIQYSGTKVPNTIKEQLASDSTGFNKLEQIINSFGGFAIIAEQVIFFDILSGLVNMNQEKY